MNLIRIGRYAFNMDTFHYATVEHKEREHFVQPAPGHEATEDGPTVTFTVPIWTLHFAGMSKPIVLTEDESEEFEDLVGNRYWQAREAINEALDGVD